MVFTKNPYVNYHDRNSKEFIQLNKGAMIDFKSTGLFDLKPSNADNFPECIDKVSNSYAYYGMICRFPTTILPDPGRTYTLGNHANLLETWNQIGLDVVLNNANIIWGDRTFTDITLHEIQNMTADQGEVTVGVCGTLIDKGKAPFLNRWRSVMLTRHFLSHLTKGGRQTIKTRFNSYE